MAHIRLSLALKELVVASGAVKNLMAGGASVATGLVAGHAIKTTSSGTLPGMSASKDMIGTVLIVVLPINSKPTTLFPLGVWSGHTHHTMSLGTLSVSAMTAINLFMPL